MPPKSRGQKSKSSGKMEEAIVHQATVKLGVCDYDFQDGQPLGKVFGKTAKLLNAYNIEVQNASVPFSLTSNRVLEVSGKRYSIKQGNLTSCL